VAANRASSGAAVSENSLDLMCQGCMNSHAAYALSRQQRNPRILCERNEVYTPLRIHYCQCSLSPLTRPTRDHHLHCNAATHHCCTHTRVKNGYLRTHAQSFTAQRSSTLVRVAANRHSWVTVNGRANGCTNGHKWSGSQSHVSVCRHVTGIIWCKCTASDR
jgi:hypothetical protein